MNVEHIPAEDVDMLPCGADWQSRHLESEKRKAEIRDRIHKQAGPLYVVRFGRSNHVHTEATGMEYTDPVTGETKKKQIKFFPDVYKDREILY